MRESTEVDQAFAGQGPELSCEIKGPVPQDLAKYLVKLVVHWEYPEEWGREGGGRGDQDGEYM